MESNKPPEENPLNHWLKKWERLQPAPPKADGLKATCWLAALGALLHPLFAYLPEKWPLFAMDGFIVFIVLIVLWHERNARKE